MSFNEAIFSKNNLDLCLRELAKEFRKLNGKACPLKSFSLDVFVNKKVLQKGVKKASTFNTQ